MSYVIAAPEIMTSAASDLATIGSNVSTAHTVAAARTLAVLPAAADEVSASIAHLFSAHAANYQATAAQAAAFDDQFVQHSTAGAFSYASIEDAIASLLQDLNVRADQLVSTLAALPSPRLPPCRPRNLLPTARPICRARRITPLLRRRLSTVLPRSRHSKPFCYYSQPRFPFQFSLDFSTSCMPRCFRDGWAGR
jgi:hypothetical protein